VRFGRSISPCNEPSYSGHVAVILGAASRHSAKKRHERCMTFAFRVAFRLARSHDAPRPDVAPSGAVPGPPVAVAQLLVVDDEPRIRTSTPLIVSVTRSRLTSAPTDGFTRPATYARSETLAISPWTSSLNSSTFTSASSSTSGCSVRATDRRLPIADRLSSGTGSTVVVSGSSSNTEDRLPALDGSCSDGTLAHPVLERVPLIFSRSPKQRSWDRRNSRRRTLDGLVWQLDDRHDAQTWLVRRLPAGDTR
jgi:hypothetical protein